MTVLGSYPSSRYNRSWIVQRLFNRLPEWAHARKSVTSIGQQFLNPISLDIEDTFQQLAAERYNLFISTADVGMLDSLYRVDLTTGMEFAYTEDSSGERQYTPPRVYATISGTEYELTQAEDNDIKSLSANNLPSRIEDGETNYSYAPVIPETSVANLSSVAPADLPISGHLYITLKDNTNWEQRTSDHIYYPKVYITGLTRKGTRITEAVPLRYNGTFKTINEWQEVDSLFASYLDSTATIAVELFPHNREFYLDSRNICVPPVGGERLQFTCLGSRSWGSTFIAEAFTVANMDIVREGDFDEKEVSYEIELLDTDGDNVDLVNFIHRPNTRFIYAISEDKFYVYDMSLPFPDTHDMTEESSEATMDLVSDRWVVVRGDTAAIQTHNLDLKNVPWKVRWSVLDPDDNNYYLGLDGTFWPTTVDAWIDNDQWDQRLWREQKIEFQLTKTGRYIVSIECAYLDPLTNLQNTLTSKFLFFAPSISPEAEFDIPVSLTSPNNIGLSSDNQIWLSRYDGIHLLDCFFDYFLVDYERGRVWLKEDYSSVRITI